MIGFLGYYGHNSRGDDLIVCALEQLFGDGLVFTVSSPNRPTPVPLEEVNRLDALIIGGGTLLGTALPYPLCDPDWIEGIEVPLYIFGAGAKFPHRAGALAEGHLDPRLLEPHRALARKARFFGVRGRLTQKVLDREKIITTVMSDPVLALVPWTQSEKSPVSRWLINFRHPDWFGQADYGPTAQRMVELLGQVVPLQGLAFDSDDARFLESLGLTTEVPDLPSLVRMVQGSAGVIAMRLHACVLAAVCRKPFLSLGYELKNWDFQQTVAPVAPIDFVPHAPSAEAIIRHWRLFQVEVLRDVFLDMIEVNVSHWREALIQWAKAILEEMGR